MLLFDMRMIGNRLLGFRKRSGLTQAEVAELAGISNRTYADIERGTVNMRVETLLRICDVLHITPDEILTSDAGRQSVRQEDILSKLELVQPKDKETALRLLDTYLRSLD